MSQDFSVLLHTPTDGTDGDCTASLKNPRGIEPRRILPQPRGSQAHTCMSPQSSDCLTFIHNLKPSDPSIFFRTPHSPKATKGAFPKILVQDIKNFPLPNIPQRIQKIIEERVDSILNLKHATSQYDTIAQENEIDLILYHLYDMTYDEVLIIDPQTPISREEYESFNL